MQCSGCNVHNIRKNIVYPKNIIIRGKLAKSLFSISGKRAKGFLELIHFDVGSIMFVRVRRLRRFL